MLKTLNITQAGTFFSESEDGVVYIEMGASGTSFASAAAIPFKMDQYGPAALGPADRIIIFAHWGGPANFGIALPQGGLARVPNCIEIYTDAPSPNTITAFLPGGPLGTFVDGTGSVVISNTSGKAFRRLLGPSSATIWGYRG